MYGIQDYSEYFFRKLDKKAKEKNLELLLHLYFSSQNEECGMIMVRKDDKTVLVGRYRIEGRYFTIFTIHEALCFEPGQDEKEEEAIRALLDYERPCNKDNSIRLDFREKEDEV